MSADASPATPGEAALAVAMRALALVAVELDRGRRLSVVAVADRRIRTALDLHRAQVEAEDAAVALIARLTAR